jgi:hypothetical protein
MVKAPALFTLVCGLTLVGCHDPNAYILGPSAVDKVVAVMVSPKSIPANGISRSIITAQLDPLTDADKRTVTFTVSAGTLIGGGKEGSTTTVQADTTGKAVVELKSATTPGMVRLDVTAGSVSRSATVEFSAVAIEDLFDVAVSRNAIPADGFSTTRVTVSLKQLGTLQQRLVKFETSAGTLLGAGLMNPHQANVPADSNGIAAVELQSDKTIGTARLTISALDATREVPIAFVPADSTQIITVTADPAVVAGDGATSIILIARVAPNLPSGRRSVTFRTTLGQFLPGRRDEFSIDADASNAARATLVSSAIGVGRVTATVDGTTADATVQFAVAMPDRIFVSPSASTLRSGESTLVTVTLFRNVGEVSPKLQVNYAAFTATGTSIGTFSGITLSNAGVATATFNAGTTRYTGPVTIRALTDGGASGTGTVQIVP